MRVYVGVDNVAQVVGIGDFARGVEAQCYYYLAILLLSFINSRPIQGYLQFVSRHVVKASGNGTLS